MKNRIFGITIAALGLLIGGWTMAAMANSGDDGNDTNIATLDNCDPTDPAWGPTGGCMLKPKEGDVKFAEFAAFLFTPLAPPGTLIGHPSWRMQPSYLSIDEKTIRVRNGGGRTHTFTKVANFGGGFVPQLSGTLIEAPECMASPPTLAPGQTAQLNLAPGVYKFQCCIHPWMRATIRIE